MTGSNHWLNCVPLSWKPLWKLSKTEFEDGINIRFHQLPNGTPLICPAENCHESFDLAHMDQCTSGGLIIKRHDYIKVILARFAESTYGTNSIEIEPFLGELTQEECELINGNLTDKARSDILIKDFKEMHKNTYIDVRIVSVLAESYKNLDVPKMIYNIEKVKYNKYSSRIKTTLGADFIPFVMTSGGGIGPAAKMVLKTMADKLAAKSYETKSQILNEIKNDLSMSLLKSKIRGIRSIRKSLAAQFSDLRSISY